MTRRKIYLLTIILLISQLGFSYGPIAHRAISLIAYAELTPKARKQVDLLLGKKGVVYTSTWADEVRSDSDNYSYSFPWHYQNLEKNLTNSQIEFLWNEPRSEGDHLFYAIQELVSRLKANKRDAEALKFLIHFIGDLHQPMHLGRKEDLGGNRVPYIWFGNTTNIHAVWDTNLVEHKKMSYTELAEYLTHKLKHRKQEFQFMNLVDVIQKSYGITTRIYEWDYNDKNNYRYVYHFNDDLDEMLYCGGIQLAKILNQLYK